MELGKEYWENRYLSDEIGWDIGYPSTPLKEYMDQLDDRELFILIPGGGNSYEAEYLHHQGFSNVHVIDLTAKPFERLKKACPDFPSAHLHVGDFFDHQFQYDLILEQTFFCALNPGLRHRYVAHCAELLKPNGRLVGLLFDDPLFTEHPPFGGNKKEYIELFQDAFHIDVMETAYNSIKPRAGRELFINLRVEK